MSTVNIPKSTLQWHHNERDGVSNHQPHDCSFNRLFRRTSKKTSKLRVTGLCEGNSAVTVEFPAQRASNAESYSIWWHHHGHRGKTGPNCHAYKHNYKTNQTGSNIGLNGYHRANRSHILYICLAISPDVTIPLANGSITFKWQVRCYFPTCLC